MAMEDVGIGGFLSFDSDSGIASMARAQRAFTRMEGAFQSFQGSLARAGQVFGQFNMLSMAMAGAGVAGVGALAHSAIQATSEFEQMQLQLASTFNALAKGGHIKDGLALAKQEMVAIEKMAMAAPGGAQDLLNIYKSIVGPLQAQGKGLEKVRELTLGAAIAAKGFGVDAKYMGWGLGKLITGSIEEDDDIFKIMKGVGLFKGKAADWRELSNDQRFAILEQIMKIYGEVAPEFEKTWEAATSAFEDSFTAIKRAAISPLMDAMKMRLIGLNNTIADNRDSVLEMAEAFGAKLVPAFEFATDVGREILDHATGIYEWVSGIVDKADAMAKRMNLNKQLIGDIAVQAAAIGTALTVAGPAISLIGMALSPLRAVMGVLVSGLGLIGPLLGTIWPAFMTIAGTIAGPVGAAVAVLGLLFLALRRDGESVTDTFQRLFYEVLIPAWEAFKATFMPFIPQMVQPFVDAWDSIKASFMLLMDAFAGQLDIGLDDAESFGTAVGEFFGGIAVAAARAIGFIGEVISGVIYTTAHLIWAFKVAGQRIGEAMGMAYLKVRNIFSGIFNVLTAPLRAVLEFISNALDTISSTSIGKWALDKAGISAQDAQALSRDLNAMITVGPLGKAQYADIPDWGALPESPEEAHARKELARRAAAATKAKEEEQLFTPGVEVKVENKQDLNINIPLKVDGKQVASAVARHQLELSERAGANTTPWQRRSAVVNASTMIPAK